jgi:hypothetical protein
MWAHGEGRPSPRSVVIAGRLHCMRGAGLRGSQNRRNPCRCQRVNVSACTTTKVCRQSNHCPIQTRAIWVAFVARMGFMLPA